MHLGWKKIKQQEAEVWKSFPCSFLGCLVHEPRHTTPATGARDLHDASIATALRYYPSFLFLELSNGVYNLDDEKVDVETLSARQNRNPSTNIAKPRQLK